MVKSAAVRRRGAAVTANWAWLLTPAARMRRWLLARLNIATRGAKVIVRNPEGAVLLVRNSYSRMPRWTLPGGGIKRRETPAQGALREVREETACALRELAPFGVYLNLGEGRRDTVHLFSGLTSDTPTPDGFEISEAVFFPLHALPADVGKATRRRLAEWRGERTPDGRW